MCLHGQHGRFLTRDKANLWFPLARVRTPLIRTFSHSPIFYPPTTVSSNQPKTLWLIAIFLQKVAGPHVFRFMSGYDRDSRRAAPSASAVRAAGVGHVLSAVCRTSNYILLRVHRRPDTEDSCCTFLDVKSSRTSRGLLWTQSRLGPNVPACLPVIMAGWIVCWSHKEMKSKS